MAKGKDDFPITRNSDLVAMITFALSAIIGVHLALTRKIRRVQPVVFFAPLVPCFILVRGFPWYNHPRNQPAAHIASCAGWASASFLWVLIARHRLPRLQVLAGAAGFGAVAVHRAVQGMTLVADQQVDPPPRFTPEVRIPTDAREFFKRKSPHGHG
eukprot:RCo000106